MGQGDIWTTASKSQENNPASFGYGPDLNMKESIDKDSAIAFAGETSESKGHISPTWTAENNVQVDSEPAVEHRLVGWRLLSVQFW